MHESFWIDRAEKYGAAYVGDKRHNDKEHEQFYEAKKRFIKPFIPKHTKVLDYGCGVGMFADLFDKSKYIGADIIKLERSFYKDYDFRLIQPFEKIPDKVDLVLCMNVLQHIEDVDKALSSWDISEGHIILMENHKEGNEYTFPRSMNQYLEIFSRHFKIRLYEPDYFDGFNLFLKLYL